MALLDAVSYEALAVAALILLASTLVYLFRKPALPSNAPPLVTDAWPILGSLQFFTERWDYFRRSTQRSRTGNFSFYAGQWPVVALSGDQGRKVFFEEKRLGFSEGYAALLGGAPTGPGDDSSLLEIDHGGGADFNNYFNKRLVTVVRPTRLAKNLPQILKDARQMFDQLAADTSRQTDVFESIFRMVFKFTMRTVACNEIADDGVLLEKTMRLFEHLDSTATPLSISFPWMLTPAKLKRYYVGAQLYKIFSDVILAREKTGRRDDDPLQYLLDQGDKTIDILTFVLGALFAGQLNSGINTAYVLLHLGIYPTWLDRIRREVDSVADRYAPDASAPLADRLMTVPSEAWENDFPVLDMCLKETIRLHMVGTAFRKNTSGGDIPIDKSGSEVIPNNAFATFALGDTHYDPAIYQSPDEWDPSRFEPERAEDKKRTHAYLGWGVARHPCLGMRFAKIENNLIVAFFLAYFDNLRVVDRSGKRVDRIPAVDRNRPSAHKPKKRVFLQYDVRQEKGAAA